MAKYDWQALIPQIQDMLNKGYKIMDMVEKFGVPEGAISRAILRYNIKAELSKREKALKEFNDKTKEANKLFNKGKTIPQIAKRLNVSESWVYKAVNQYKKQVKIVKAPKVIKWDFHDQNLPLS